MVILQDIKHAHTHAHTTYLKNIFLVMKPLPNPLIHDIMATIVMTFNVTASMWMGHRLHRIDDFASLESSFFDPRTLFAPAGINDDTGHVPSLPLMGHVFPDDESAVEDVEDPDCSFSLGLFLSLISCSCVSSFGIKLTMLNIYT